MRPVLTLYGKDVETPGGRGLGRFAPSEARRQAITIFAGDARQFLRDLQNPWYNFFYKRSIPLMPGSVTVATHIEEVRTDLASTTARLRFIRRENFLFQSIVTH